MMTLVEVNDEEQIANTQIRLQYTASTAMVYSCRFIATEGGAEVGFLHVEFWPKEELEHCVIYEIFVPPSLRRRGIGTRLLAAAETIARNRGYRSVQLHPRTMDEEIDQNILEQWYATHGYVPDQDDGVTLLKQVI
jgi:GNAT superfamily N-acetyltransferase